jgi:nucleoside-diphosphate-sugar epimerase
MISFNLLEAARRAKTVKKFFYASSACVYPEHIQLDPNNPGLKETDAWPAHPQDAYGLEKLVSEECAKHYGQDFGIECHIGRFHNIYGPQGTWKGGREKAPAAFMRKAITSTKGNLLILFPILFNLLFCFFVCFFLSLQILRFGEMENKLVPFVLLMIVLKQ